MSEWGSGVPAHPGYDAGQHYGGSPGAPPPPWLGGARPWVGPSATEMAPIDVDREANYRVWVPAVSFQAGALPYVCPRSGKPADKSKDKKFSNPIGLEAIGILAGLLIFIILRMALEKSAKGPVHYNSAARREVQKRRLLIAAGILFGLAVISMVLIDPAMIILFVLFGVVPLVAAADVAVATGELDRPGNWLKLKNCDPGFAAAIQQSAVGPWSGIEEVRDRPISTGGLVALGVLIVGILVAVVAAAV